jgi:hypothetical protein
MATTTAITTATTTTATTATARHTHAMDMIVIRIMATMDAARVTVGTIPEVASTTTLTTVPGTTIPTVGQSVTVGPARGAIGVS